MYSREPNTQWSRANLFARPPRRRFYDVAADH